MIIANAGKDFKAYLKQRKPSWDFANGILYKMCQDNPLHSKDEIIIGKIWIIGRTYAAAIERRRNADEITGDDFYVDVVAPKIKGIGKELDKRIKKINSSKGTIKDNLPYILETHKFLMDKFFEITRLDKRSLASKYLHFHCPQMFFIYDSRANQAAKKLVKYTETNLLDNLDEDKYDKEYASFVLRMIELQENIQIEQGILESPRTLDGFLLYLDNINKK